ncbi:sarcosine oxidase subunit delta [Granulosicoccus antarcticus]|uniref:Sarcosine oxidase subunit delta n=1 Tax=Granulosicoccus antarcticus IMCC3135 TaxID=1192854 RepID=A0A2Z2NVH7_9GAMM|nr:sarcosine oxidase subunit delta [Granulosicoccus antarcticus]ASJ75476.1 Sarcosine oxidase subunit delta [Granulosicoccus antarcticus IMCC3135]
MQSFPCPFCGPRDEREFHFAGEADKIRPDTTQTISDAEWADYLFNLKNSRGPTREIWVHTPCQEYFVMERDTATMDVIGAHSLRKDIA